PTCPVHHRSPHPFPTRRSSDLNERSRRGRRWMRIEPPPSSQPLSARSCWRARARPAGSSGLGRDGSPDAVTSSSSSSGTTPLNRSEEHTSELQSLRHLVCRLLL